MLPRLSSQKSADASPLSKRAKKTTIASKLSCFKGEIRGSEGSCGPKSGFEPKSALLCCTAASWSFVSDQTTLQNKHVDRVVKSDGRWRLPRFLGNRKARGVEGEENGASGRENSRTRSGAPARLLARHSALTSPRGFLSGVSRRLPRPAPAIGRPPYVGASPAAPFPAERRRERTTNRTRAILSPSAAPSSARARLLGD